MDKQLVISIVLYCLQVECSRDCYEHSFTTRILGGRTGRLQTMKEEFYDENPDFSGPSFLCLRQSGRQKQMMDD